MKKIIVRDSYLLDVWGVSLIFFDPCCYDEWYFFDNAYHFGWELSVYDYDAYEMVLKCVRPCSFSPEWLGDVVDASNCEVLCLTNLD